MKKDKSVKLKAIREKIDSIDDQIIKLVAKRFNEIHKVAELKEITDKTWDRPRSLKFSSRK